MSLLFARVSLADTFPNGSRVSGFRGNRKGNGPRFRNRVCSQLQGRTWCKRQRCSRFTPLNLPPGTITRGPAVRLTPWKLTWLKSCNLRNCRDAGETERRDPGRPFPGPLRPPPATLRTRCQFTLTGSPATVFQIQQLLILTATCLYPRFCPCLSVEILPHPHLLVLDSLSLILRPRLAQSPLKLLFLSPLSSTSKVVT